MNEIRCPFCGRGVMRAGEKKFETCTYCGMPAPHFIEPGDTAGIARWSRDVRSRNRWELVKFLAANPTENYANLWEIADMILEQGFGPEPTEGLDDG